MKQQFFDTFEPSDTMSTESNLVLQDAQYPNDNINVETIWEAIMGNNPLAATDLKAKEKEHQPLSQNYNT